MLIKRRLNKRKKKRRAMTKLKKLKNRAVNRVIKHQEGVLVHKREEKKRMKLRRRKKKRSKREKIMKK
jgi:hypothetical protein